MPDPLHTKAEPQSFVDLPMQPTGSGVADEQTAFLEAALEGATGETIVDTDVTDEHAHAETAIPTEGGPDEAASEAQPS